MIPLPLHLRWSAHPPGRPTICPAPPPVSPARRTPDPRPLDLLPQEPPCVRPSAAPALAAAGRALLRSRCPSLVVPQLRFDSPIRVMPSLGAAAGELPYAPLQAAVLRGSCGVAAHDLGGQPEALVLQALYLPAHLLGPHATLHRGPPAPPPQTATLCGFSASGEVVVNRSSSLLMRCGDP